MSIFEQIDPLEPLLWIEETPLLTLTYLWHLSQEDIDQRSKSDLLWKLTRQLLIVHEYKATITPNPEFIKKQLQQLLENEVISSLINSKVIKEENLTSILEIQDIYFSHLNNLRDKIIQQLSADDKDLQEYYDKESQFERENVFEVYQCSMHQKPEKTPSTLEDLAKYTKDLIWIGVFTVEELQNYTSGLYIPKIEEIPILIKLSEEGKYLFIEQFYTSYKAPYAKIKETLIYALAENSLEYKIEEETQKYLEHKNIKYNEDAIKKVFDLDGLI